mmetsp:Transcript_37099/g.78870  ORF Transcript_37099/g.78870 Transcript_37099/m.78870 type:complete len:969 (+) Transcript_37099:75-2981(+)
MVTLERARWTNPTHTGPFAIIIIGILWLVCHCLVFAQSLRLVDLLYDIGDSSGSWSKTGIDFGTGLETLSGEIEGVVSAVVRSMEILEELDATIGDVMIDFGAALECMNNSGVKINLTDLGALRKNTMTAPIVESLRAQIMTPWSVSDAESMLQVSMTTHDSIGLETEGRGASRKMHRRQPHLQGGCGKGFVCLSSGGACPASMGELTDFVDRRVEVLYDRLLEFSENFEPALTLLRRWIHTTTPEVTTFLNEFSDILSKAQTIFEGVLKILPRPKGDWDSMVNRTFNLFDVSNSGLVTLHDLKQMSILYGIAALEDPDRIFEQYDTKPSDGNLSMHEFRNFLQHGSLPDMMGVVLRTYATKLSALAGPLRAAQTRSAVTSSMARYLELVTVKNSTKATWICQTLTNGSLPVNVTAGVLKELAVAATDPNRKLLTSVDVGLVVAKTMMGFNETHVHKAVELLSRTEFWVNEGFDTDIQADTFHRISTWVLRAGSGSPNEAGNATENRTTDHSLSLRQVRAAVEHERGQYAKRQRRSADKDWERIMGSKTTQALLQSSFRAHFPGSVIIKPDVLQAIQSGQLAAPETIEFANWLATNISRTSTQFLADSIVYSTGVGQTLDLTKIGQVVDSIAAAVMTLVRYISLDGEDEMRKDIERFRINATWEMLVTMSSIQANPAQGIHAMVDDAFGAWYAAERLFMKLKDPLPRLKQALERTSGLAGSAERTVKNAFNALHRVNRDFIHTSAEHWRTFSKVYFGVWAVLTFLFVAFMVWYVHKFNTDPPWRRPRDVVGGALRTSEEISGKVSEVPYEPPRTWRGCCDVVGNAILWSVTAEYSICWTSTMLVIEVLCLTVYVVCVLVSLIFAATMLMSSQCTHIGLLYDKVVCGTYMKVINTILVSFRVVDPLGQVMCEKENFLACKVVNEHSAAFLTYIACSVLQIVFAMLLLVESSVLVERCRLQKVLIQLKEE